MRITNHLCLILAAALSLAACQNRYDRVDVGGTERISARLDRQAAVLIMTPADAVHADKTYKGTGDIIARMADASFSRYARIVDVNPGPYTTVEDIRGLITQNSYGYIVVPTFIAWEPQQDWYNPITHAVVKLSIIDALTGNEISSNFLEGKGTTVEGYSPISERGPGVEWLLAHPLDAYVDVLYSHSRQVEVPSVPAVTPLPVLPQSMAPEAQPMTPIPSAVH